MTELYSPRERVLKAIRHEQTDRVPIDFGGRVSGIAISAYRELIKELCFDTKDEIFNKRLQIARVDPNILDRFKVDIRHICPAPPQAVLEQREQIGSYRDEWGVLLKKPQKGFYFDYADAPLAKATKGDLDKYNWPDIKDLSRIEGKDEEAARLTEEGRFALFTVFKGVFERSWALRGMEQFFVDMLADQDFAEALLEKVLQIQMELYGPFLECTSQYMDLVCITEDLGSQTAPLISPKLYRELIRPFHQRWIDFVREKTSAHIAIHSCGRVLEFIPDLIDMGVEVLNPVQVTAEGMDLSILKQNYGRHLCFWGAIDTQHLLPFASLPEIEKAVKETVDILGKGGGYILAPAHNIQPLTDPGKIIKMFDTVVGN